MDQRLGEALKQANDLNDFADKISGRLAQLEQDGFSPGRVQSRVRELETPTPSPDPKENGSPQVAEKEVQILMQHLESVEAEKNSLLSLTQTLAARMNAIEAGTQVASVPSEPSSTIVDMQQQLLSAEQKHKQQLFNAEQNLKQQLLFAEQNHNQQLLLAEQKHTEMLDSHSRQYTVAVQEREGLQGRVVQQQQLIAELEGSLSGARELLAASQEELRTAALANSRQGVVPLEQHQQACEELQQRLLQADGSIQDLQNQRTMYMKDAQDLRLKLSEKEKQIVGGAQERSAEATLIQNLREQVRVLENQLSKAEAPSLVSVTEHQILQDSYEALKRDKGELEASALRNVEEQSRLIKSLESALELKSAEVEKLSMQLSTVKPNSWSLDMTASVFPIDMSGIAEARLATDADVLKQPASPGTTLRSTYDSPLSGSLLAGQPSASPSRQDPVNKRSSSALPKTGYVIPTVTSSSPKMARTISPIGGQAASRTSSGAKAYQAIPVSGTVSSSSSMPFADPGGPRVITSPLVTTSSTAAPVGAQPTLSYGAKLPGAATMPVSGFSGSSRAPAKAAYPVPATTTQAGIRGTATQRYPPYVSGASSLKAPLRQPVQVTTTALSASATYKIA